MSVSKVVALAVFVLTIVGALFVVVQGNPRLLLAEQAAYIPSQPLGYIPLGDSYTIGVNVPTEDRYPNQLAMRFGSNGLPVEIITNPARSGYTSQQVIDTELPVLKNEKPDLITVLVGMNDYRRGVPLAAFKANLEVIVNDARQQLAPGGTLLLIDLPDADLTPEGTWWKVFHNHGLTIPEYNDVIRQVAAEHQLPLADIYTVSMLVSNKPDWITTDRFHPSGKQYAAWTKQIYQALLCQPHGLKIKRQVADASGRPELGLFGQQDQCNDSQALRLADAQTH